MIAGICGGIGEHLDIDPTVIRVLWLLFTILSYGICIIAHIIAWVIISREGSAKIGPLSESLS